MKIKFLIFIFIFSLIYTHGLLAHGTKYEIIDKNILAIKAMFDSGIPMANSKVLLFPPGEAKASITTQTDENGIFYIAPEKSGTWVAQVRESGGHGMRINLEIDESMQVKGGSRMQGSGTTMLQKIIMAACVIWGFIGTALYFRGKKGVE